MSVILQKYLWLVVLCVIVKTVAFSQHIEITVEDLTVSKAAIFVLSGEKVTFVDSVRATLPGQFAFALKPGHNHAGIYRISFDQSRWVDFVNDNEDVKISTVAASLLDSAKILTSESNLIYYSYVKLNKQFKTKSELLQLILARYPGDDPFYASARAAAEALGKEYRSFVSTSVRLRPGAFIARYVRSSQLPMPNFSTPVEGHLAFQKSHALDSVDFSDEGLLYSDAFAGKSIEYLTYYRNPQLPKDLLEREFMAAVDTILGKARVNQAIYQHITEYLIDGFKKFGFEKCVEYILDTYVIKDGLCLGDRLGDTVQRMIAQKQKLAAGAVAPELALPDTSGRIISLQSVEAERTLIVFYSTACPHCQTMMPRLAELYRAKDEDMPAILAVSLDSNTADWTKFIRSHNLTWLNVNDPKGWGGSAALEYCIYATPTMVLVDRHKKVIARFATVEELSTYL